MLLDSQRPDLVSPLREVSDPKELVFIHQSLPADLGKPIIQPMLKQGSQGSLSLEPRGKWFIQVGRFENAATAAEIRDTMRQAGYPTDLYEQETSGEIHQRIWVGPYYTQSEAEHVLEGIKAKKALTDVHQGWVIRQP